VPLLGCVGDYSAVQSDSLGRNDIDVINDDVSTRSANSQTSDNIRTTSGSANTGGGGSAGGISRGVRFREAR